MKYKYEYLYKGNPYQLTPMWSLLTTMTNMGPRVTRVVDPSFPHVSRTLPNHKTRPSAQAIRSSGTFRRRPKPSRTFALVVYRHRDNIPYHHTINHRATGIAAPTKAQRTSSNGVSPFLLRRPLRLLLHLPVPLRLPLLPVPAPRSVPRRRRVLPGRRRSRAGGGEGGPAAQGRVFEVGLRSRPLRRFRSGAGARGGQDATGGGAEEAGAVVGGGGD
uniref:Uncharacterized protein n=1 Tax=Zea mays TaxID=4577 RepID=Q9ZSX5_MAIZE|nr:unknown [Zea mays]